MWGSKWPKEPIFFRTVFGMFFVFFRNSHPFNAKTLRHLLGNFIIVLDTRPRIELVADPRSWSPKCRRSAEVAVGPKFNGTKCISCSIWMQQAIGYTNASTAVCHHSHLGVKSHGHSTFCSLLWWSHAQWSTELQASRDVTLCHFSFSYPQYFEPCFG